ncbi:MAG: hypothetical protein RJB38_663 [Pseudomonadota bacterium]|jgi:hypothetical protein
MKTTRRHSFMLIIFATVSLAGNPARAWDVFRPTTDGLSIATISMLLVSVLDDMSQNDHLKKAVLAQNALDYAAVFYESGNLSGVLPAVLKTLRDADPELEKLNQVDLVDAIVAEAEKALNSQVPQKD